MKSLAQAMIANQHIRQFLEAHVESAEHQIDAFARTVREAPGYGMRNSEHAFLAAAKHQIYTMALIELGAKKRSPECGSWMATRNRLRRTVISAAARPCKSTSPVTVTYEAAELTAMATLLELIDNKFR